MAEGITDDNVMQALFDYASNKYGRDSKVLFEKYLAEFPEKGLKLDPQKYTNNFLAWLFTEKALPWSGKTIAEEFAQDTPELSLEMKGKLAGMKNVIRSKFIVLSSNGVELEIKDARTGKTYRVKLVHPADVRPNDAMEGRIHPYGDRYRFAGVYALSRTPLILDPDVMMSQWQDSEIERLENELLLHPDSRLGAILHKYPFQWIDGICRRLGVRGRLKREKIAAIGARLAEGLDGIVAGLPASSSREALKICVDNGGFVKCGKLAGYDDRVDFFWNERNEEETAVGALRKRGLVAVGRMPMDGRMHRVALIPLEIRGKLQEILGQKQ